MGVDVGGLVEGSDAFGIGRAVRKKARPAVSLQPHGIEVLMMEVRVLIQEIRVLIGRFPAAARLQVLLRAVHPRRAEAHRDAWSHELGILVHRPPGSRLLAWARIAVKTTCVRLRSSSTELCTARSMLFGCAHSGFTRRCARRSDAFLAKWL